MSKNEYTADNIKLPSDTQHIFMRPGMYIGDTDNPKHLFVEATDNAIDEAMNGYSNLTEVSYDTKSNEIIVIDHGRGIPHGMKEIRNSNNKVIDKMSVLEILMTRNNSGGKFDNDSFKIRGGLHGLGMKIINALSDHVWIQTRRDGEAVTYESTNHGVKVGDIKVEPMDTSDNHGTEIHFTPTEDNIFEITKIPKQFIIDKCEIANAFGYKILLTINGKKIDLGEGNLSHLLPKADEKTSTYITKEFSSSLDDGESVRALLEYTSNTSSEYNAFTNLLFNSSGGTHVYSYQSALINAWKPFIGDRFIKPSDVLLGSKSVIAVFIEDPLFSSQTKERLSVPKKQLENLFKGLEVKFHKFLEDNKPLREALLDRFEEYRMSQSKLQSQKEIDKLLIVNDAKKSNGKIRRRSVVPKLLECTSKDRSDTELYITEGDSSKGSVVQTRDVKYQAVYPIRGKILNVARGINLLDSLKNEEVKGIVNSIGAGIGDKCNSENSRYERIILSCFTGDTRVKLLNGTVPTFEELAKMEKDNPGRDYWVYSVDTNNHNKLVPGLAHNPRITGYKDKLIEVTLDDDSKIRCTPEHRFLTRDYGYVEASELKPEMSLVPLYSKVGQLSQYKNYEAVVDPSDERWKPTHRVVKESFQDIKKGLLVHHLDHNKLDNSPENLIVVTKSEHAYYHPENNTDRMITYNLSDKHRKTASELQLDPKKHELYSEFIKVKPTSESIDNFIKEHPEMNNYGPLILYKFNLSEKHKDQVISMNKDENLKFLQMIGKVKKSLYYMSKKGIDRTPKNYNMYRLHAALTYESLINKHHIDPLKLEVTKEYDLTDYKPAKDTDAKYGGKGVYDKNKKRKVRTLKLFRKVLDEGLEVTPENYQNQRTSRSDMKWERIEELTGETIDQLIEEAKVYNHKVQSIRYITLDKPIPVYCMTVEKYHNFAVGYTPPQVSSNVEGGDQIGNAVKDLSFTFVHNCDADP